MKYVYASFLISLFLVCGSMEAEVGEYLIDVGFSSEEITEGTPVVFDFSLLALGNNEEVAFTSVWIQLRQKEKTVFASGLDKARFGKTTMLYTFPAEGEYTLTTRFRNVEAKLAEESFSFQVLSSESESSSESNSFPRGIVTQLLLVGMGGVFGFALSLLFRKRKT